MKLLALAILFSFLCGPALASNCSSPPQGFGGSWAREYKAWCEACCGTYSTAGPSCNPGPNWGCRGGEAQTGTAQPSDEAARQAAARKRREEAERRHRDEEAAEAARRKEYERQRDEISKSMKGIAGGELGLKGLADDEPRLRELNDDRPAPAPAAKKVPVANRAPPDFPSIDGMERSPGFEAWLRGMDAVVAQDWQLALAWFKTAKLKDPLNPTLGRAVDLAEWTWQGRKRAALQASKPASNDAPKNAKLQSSPKNEDLELLFFPKPDRPKGAPRLPKEKDIEFLFFPDDNEAALIELCFPGTHRHAPARIDPDWGNQQISTAVRTAYADELAVQAILLVDKKDYDSAIALLTKAEKQAPHIENYRRTRLLVQQWAERKKNGG